MDSSLWEWLGEEKTGGRISTVLICDGAEETPLWKNLSSRQPYIVEA